VTSPPRRRYDNGPRDNKHQVAPNYAVCGRDSQPASASRGAALVSCDVVDSMLRGRRLDLAAAAAAADDDDDDDDDDATSSRNNETTRTAVRPWLLHRCDH